MIPFLSVTLSPRDRRALALGTALVGIVLVLTRGVPAYTAWLGSAREDARAVASELATADASLRSRKAAAESLAVRSRRLIALAPAALAGRTPSAAGSELAGIVASAATMSNVRIGSVSVRPDRASAGTFTRVAVRADAVGDIRGLSELLASLERGPALLVVRELSITQPEPAAGDDRPEELRIELLVEVLAVNARAARPAGVR